MNAHTPGVWSFSVDPDTQEKAVLATSDDDTRVLFIAESDVDLPEEVDANLRLAAAAPDLLAAAEDALSVLTIDLRGLDVAKPEIEKLRAAIATAKTP